MNSNFIICRNEVFIEDVNVGQFESFECRADSRTFGASAILTMPLYAIGRDRESRARSRVRNKVLIGDTEDAFNLIRPSAQVRVECWYDSWNVTANDGVGGNEPQERIVVFNGFIEHVAEGFPTKIYLQDNTFLLRFGDVEDITGASGWTGDLTLQRIIEDVIPIAQKAFDNERKKCGFERSIPKLTYSNEKHNVQALTDPMTFRQFGGGSPYDIIQRIVSTLVLYGGVSNEFNVYVGAGVTESTRPRYVLDTRYNVIERDIVLIDSRFVSYDVRVTGVLKNGRRHTARGGQKITTSGESETHFEEAYGETYRSFTTMDTRDGIQAVADRLLKSLQGERNKGKIKILLYPKIEIMDWVEYTDTIFEDFNAGFYVLDYEFRADEKGYYQTLGVTDRVFAI